MRSAAVRRALLAVALLAVVTAPARAADRSFSWHGEMVGVEGTLATLRVPLSDAALRLAADQRSGTPVTLVWSAAGDVVVYAPPATEMARVPSGFLVDAELLSVDKGARLATVRVQLPPEVAKHAGGLSGRWVKATMPVTRAATRTAGIAVVASTRPVAPTAQSAAGAAAGISGTWTITAVRRSGVSVGADCSLREAAGRLTGTCTSNRFGSSPISGEIRGSAVTFHFDVPIQGDIYIWSGDLAPSGTAMKGTVQVSDETVAFTATK